MIAILSCVHRVQIRQLQTGIASVEVRSQLDEIWSANLQIGIRILEWKITKDLLNGNLQFLFSESVCLWRAFTRRSLQFFLRESGRKVQRNSSRLR